MRLLLEQAAGLPLTGETRETGAECAKIGEVFDCHTKNEFLEKCASSFGALGWTPRETEDSNLHMLKVWKTNGKNYNLVLAVFH